MFENYPKDKESKTPTSFCDIEWVFNKNIKELHIDDKKYIIDYDKSNIEYYKNLLELFKIISKSKNVYIIKDDVQINLLYFPNDAKKLLEEYDKTNNQKINWEFIK
jgi:hypothetical protein